MVMVAVMIVLDVVEVLVVSCSDDGGGCCFGNDGGRIGSDEGCHGGVLLAVSVTATPEVVVVVVVAMVLDSNLNLILDYTILESLYRSVFLIDKKLGTSFS